MFNVYTQALARLYRVEGFPRQAADILMGVLARCDGTLDFRGEIKVDKLTVRDGLPGATANYAVATATWVRASGHDSYVMCRAATDPIGTLTSDAATFRVYLPRSNAALDPNVYSGDVLQYVTIDSVNYAVGTTYLDAEIGSLKPMTHTGAGHGWKLCDGDGDTDDFTDKFVRGAATYGTPGGSDTHTHTADIDDASPGLTGETADADTDIGIDDHPDHMHAPRDTPVGITEGTDRDVYGALQCTGMAIVPGFPDSCADATALGDLVHNITDPGHKHGAGTLAVAAHGHNITIDAANNIPAYIGVVWWVRVGPAGEIV